MLATFQMNKEYFSTAVASLTPRSITSNLKDSANVKTPWTLMSYLVKPKDNESVNTSLANCSIQLPYGRSKCPFNNEPWKQSINHQGSSFVKVSEVIKQCQWWEIFHSIINILLLLTFTKTNKPLHKERTTKELIVDDIVMLNSFQLC